MFFFSIIIPFNKCSNFLIENIKSLNNQVFKNFELLLVSNDNNTLKKIQDHVTVTFEIKHILSLKTEPSYKRNLASKSAVGSYLVFIDDDAYPDAQWLQLAHDNILLHKINVLGGPSLTPDNDGFIAKLSSLFYESKIGGGSPERYSSVDNLTTVDDWPSVNFFIKKEIFNLIEGFEDKIWPGEDTHLCEKLKNKNYIIHYNKNLIVFHHRRNSLFKHLKQLFNYGFNRGYLIKKKYINFRFKNILPTLLIINVLLLIFSYYINNTFTKIISLPLLIYFILVIGSSIKLIKKKLFLFSLLFTPFVLISHISYGAGFLYSLLKRNYLLLKR